MASFLNAHLPSDDEEDDEYDPTKDPTGEKEAGEYKNGAARGNKRRRGALAAGGAAEEQPADGAGGDDVQGGPEAEAAQETPAQLAKKAKVAAIWQQMQSKPTGRAGASAAGPASKGVSLSSLCRSADKPRSNPDMLWMRNLGLTPKQQQPSQKQQQQQQQQQAPVVPTASEGTTGTPNGSGTPGQADETAAARGAAAAEAGPSSSNGSEAKRGPDPGMRSAAAAALAAAKEAASMGVGRSYNKVQVTETRRFAGKDIQVVREVEAGSKEAAKAADRGKPAASGLDSFLAEIEKKKKVTVLDKSKQDWQEFKKTDAAVEEELEAYKKSSDKYLDKVDFLKRAELREYELERDKRLASDVRTRGRL